MKENMLACMIGPVARMQDAHDGLTMTVSEPVAVLTSRGAASNAPYEVQYQCGSPAETLEREGACVLKMAKRRVGEVIAAPVCPGVCVRFLAPCIGHVVGDSVFDICVGGREGTSVATELLPGHVACRVLDIHVDRVILLNSRVGRTVVEM